MLTRKPRLLDLFCGAGGAAMGYSRAGFDVVGIDIVNQPRFPFPFIQGDALNPPVRLEDFDVVHASPPCQAYSIMRNLPWLRDRDYPRLIEPTIAMLREWGGPFVLENVMGARLDANWLCGQMFGLPFFRHRLFASNWLWLVPPHPKHQGTVRNGRTMGSRARDIVAVPQQPDGGLTAWFKANGARRMGANVGHAAGVALAKEAMQIDWMKREELTQAIPPAYTQFIGEQLIDHLARTEAHAHS